MIITCPVCGFTMSEYNSDSKIKVENPKVLQNIQLCHMCGSVWVSGKYINQILALTELPDNIDIEEIFAEQTTLTKGGDRMCPECYEDLFLTSKNIVLIDMCKSCNGILFDRQELRLLWSVIHKKTESNSLTNYVKRTGRGNKRNKKTDSDIRTKNTNKSFQQISDFENDNNINSSQPTKPNTSLTELSLVYDRNNPTNQVVELPANSYSITPELSNNYSAQKSDIEASSKGKEILTMVTNLSVDLENKLKEKNKKKNSSTEWEEFEKWCNEHFEKLNNKNR